jgi:aerobic-type carbon monoxide dehydrogenase small subunit (CoxS/CutS family)
MHYLSAGECMRIELTVKGPPAPPDIAPNALLVGALRHRPQPTGAHVGCATPQRDASTVLPAGRGAKSRNLPQGQGDGRTVTTIEGLDAPLRPMQAAFGGCHGPAIPAS